MPAQPHLRAARTAVVSFGAVLALAVVAVMALSRADAAAKQLSCGATITTDTTLDSDLVDCPNNGIIIGADDITLDLNGHRIDGDGKPAAGCNPRKEICDTGVGNDGHDRVTVKDGSTREFVVGVLVGTSSAGKVRHNRLLDISSSRNQFAGFVVADVARSLVRNTSGNGSITPEGGTGIYLVASDHVRILDSSFRNNGDRGMGVYSSAHNLIEGNRLSHNFALGILLERSDHNRVRGNRSVRDSTGVTVLHSDRNVIARNRIVHAGGGGGDGEAIQVPPRSDHNVIARNSIRDTLGNGIHAGAMGNAVRGNHITLAGKNGVRVTGGAKHLVLRRNHVRHAKDDGLNVKSRSTRLTKNRAERNGDLGIEAVKGVIDGGGNRASGNGDRRQCVHVSCH